MGGVAFEEHIIFILGNTTNTSFPMILKASIPIQNLIGIDIAFLTILMVPIDHM